MSTLDGHLCVCGHSRRSHGASGCIAGCGCSTFSRKSGGRRSSGERQTSKRMRIDSSKMVTTATEIMWGGVRGLA